MTAPSLCPAGVNASEDLDRHDELEHLFPILADFIAEARFRRDVEAVHRRGARAVFEMVAQIARAGSSRAYRRATPST
jgi:hypothetical protein